MSANVIYNTDTTENSFSEIEAAINTELIARAKEYDDIIALFAKSQCEHVDAMKNMLTVEKAIVGSATEMLQNLMQMLRNASVDLTEVEKGYSTPSIQEG